MVQHFGWVKLGFNIVSAAASVPCVILDDCQQKVYIYSDDCVSTSNVSL